MASVDRKKLVWTGLTIGIGIAAGSVAERLLGSAWTALGGGDPPQEAADRRRPILDVLIWGAAAGGLAGLLRAVITRSASATWELVTATAPPGTTGAKPEA